MLIDAGADGGTVAAPVAAQDPLGRALSRSPSSA